MASAVEVFDIRPSPADVLAGMPQITRENAAEMQRRAQVAIAVRKERARLDREKLAAMPAIADELARNKRVFAQIDRVDSMLEDCRAPDLFSKLVGAKERLWGLVIPRAGSFRPRPTSRRRQPVVFEEPTMAEG